MHWISAISLSVHDGPVCLMNFVASWSNFHFITLYVADASNCLATSCEPVLTLTTTEQSWLACHHYQETGNIALTALLDMAAGDQVRLASTQHWSGNSTALCQGQKTWRLVLKMATSAGHDDDWSVELSRTLG